MKKRVLVLSGGGIMGTITATALKNFQKTIDKPINEYFDLIVGTSTGAIIGSMLAAGVYITQIQDMYLNEGKHIFTPQNSWWLPWRKLTRPLYDRNRVIKPMQSLLDFFKINLYGELKTKFICTSVNCQTKENVCFKSTSTKNKSLKIVDVVSRSYAAPLYFGLLNVDSEKIVYSDGGTGLFNFPLIPAYEEIVSMSSPEDEIEIYCFGTGYSTTKTSYEEMSKWENIQELWNVFLDKGETLSREQARVEQVNAMRWIESNNKNLKFFYYDVEVPEKMNKLDGVDFIQDYVNFGNSIKF